MVSEKTLVQIGLSEKESKIYLACLTLGKGTVLQISREADVSRGSCYDLLNDMLEKAYVSKIHKAKHIIFSPVDPEALLKRSRENIRDFELALPELKGLFHKQSQPRVRYFEGIDGIKRVYEDTLTATTGILNYTNSLEVRRYWPNYDEEYIQLRAKKKIFLKCIAPNDPSGQEVKQSDPNFSRETRLLSAEEFRFTNEINIYDNKVAITSFHNELIGILIESKEIADTQRDIFRMAWAFAGMTQ